MLRRLWGERRILIGIWALLILAGLAMLAGINRRDPIFQIHLDNKRQVSYEEAMALAQRLDRLLDRIEASGADLEIPATVGAARAWVLELAPMFEYEGFSSFTTLPLVTFFISKDPQAHNHLGGRSDCSQRFILNGRYGNPVSSWSDDPNWVAILAHELAHNHQGPLVCGLHSRLAVETAAQLGSWEVLASLANRGNKYALYALIRELRSSALSTARAIAWDDHDLARWEIDYYRLIDGDPARWSRYKASVRAWAANEGELKRILMTYSSRPTILLFYHAGHGWVPQLALSTRSKRLTIDDLVYFLRHAEELVEANIIDPL